MFSHPRLIQLTPIGLGSVRSESSRPEKCSAMPCQKRRTLSQKKSGQTSCGERDLRLILREYLLRLSQRLVPQRLLMAGLLLPLAKSHLIMLDGEAAQSLHVKSGYNNNPPKIVPRLLFRFSDDASAAKGPFLKDSTGFIAGSFVANPSDIPPVPTEILKALAFMHLTPDQRISQTPFISFFSTMLPTFHRALRFV